MPKRYLNYFLFTLMMCRCGFFSFLTVFLVLNLREDKTMGYNTFVPIQMDELPPLSIEDPAPSMDFSLGGSAVVGLNRDPLMRFAIREGLLNPIAAGVESS